MRTAYRKASMGINLPAGALAALVVLSLLFAAAPALDPVPAAAAVPINRNRIKQVIYPTLGFPAIVESGGELTIEFDPRDQDWRKPLPGLTDFEVTVTTTNCAFPVTKKLPLEHFTTGYSTRWPEFSAAREPRARIYLVTVAVPRAVPLHLHDLTVKGEQADGTWLADSQPHALQAVDEFKDDFTFAQLTDIHVWGPEAHYPGALSTHERNYRHADYREADGYGATYYHKAIRQMNRMNPDFIVYTGDYDFSQKWLYKQDYAAFKQYKNSPWNGKYYEPHFEMDWFYEETLKLDVPVFMTVGNHDGYARYDFFNLRIEEDYLDSWRNLFGPQYFSFDYGPDYHFTAVNTMDWSSADRNLHWAIPDVILSPGKWQGQVRSGGDTFAAGWSQAREDAVNENDFTSQLLWIKDDLESHTAAKARIVLAHHDPWKKDGSGEMFDDAQMFGPIYMGGKGDGRLALIKLARKNNVALLISGHAHSDSYGSISWEGGGDEVRFVNTTSTMLQDAPSTWSPNWSSMWVFPGYRLFDISNGQVVNYYYKLADDQGGNPLPYSWPFYEGTNVGGTTNFMNLSTPAVESEWAPMPGTAESVTCTLTNHLTGREVIPGGYWSGDLRDASMEFAMPMLADHYYYTVANGDFAEVFNSDSGATRVYQVVADVDHAADDASPTVKDVTVEKSANPDETAPACDSFLIDGGAASTLDARVTLTNDASDAGGSGLLDMMISNDDPTFAGCGWQRYEPETEWTLAKTAGVRTVYTKFRDRAMPGNVSDVKQGTITLVGDPPTITSVTPGAAYVGGEITLEGTGFGEPRTEYDRVFFNGLLAGVVSWEDEKIACTVPYGAATGIVTVFTDAGSESAEFHVMPTIDSVTPGFGYNSGPVHISNLEGTGFYEEGSYPDVKLWNGTTEIFATDVEVVSPQSITCGFDITGMPVGHYNLIVHNVDGHAATLSGGFAVDYPPPDVSGITPDSGANDSVVSITNLSGADFRPGLEAWLKKDGAEIKATDVAVLSAGRATCRFDLRGAAVGAWDVYVENDDHEHDTLAGGFNVGYPAPQVSSISPDTGADDGVVRGALVRGANFRAGAAVALTRKGHAEIRASNVVVNPPAGITCDFDLRGAAPGAWSVRMTNDDGKSAALAGGFEVKKAEVLEATWYLPEGSTAWGFDTYLAVVNPNKQAVNARVTYMTTEGQVDGGTFAMQPETRLTVNPSAVVPNADFSTKVECLENRPIAVDRTVTWDQEAHNSIGVNSPSKTWFLPEGCSAWGFETWTLVQNPNDREASIKLTYMTEGSGALEFAKTVPANSRRTFNMVDDIGEQNASIEVSSDVPVIPERAMYRNGREQGHDSVGSTVTSNDYFLAEGTTAWGFETWLLVQNPGEGDSTVTVTYMTPDGPVAQEPFVLTGRSRRTIKVSDVPGMGSTDFSARVGGSSPLLAERAMYWNNGAKEACHDSIGMPAANRTFLLPDGQTSQGCETYVLVANPNDSEVKVTVTCFTDTGHGNASFDDVISANSRRTYNIAEWVPSGRVSVRVAGDKPVMVERAMYWGDRAFGTDSIGANQ